MFEDIDRLVAYFQRHIDDPLQESVPSIRSVAAMVPMRSPADHGSSGGSGWGSSQNEGGWKGNSDRSGSGNAFQSWLQRVSIDQYYTIISVVLTRILHEIVQNVLQGGVVITEMVVDVMGIQVERQGHMVVAVVVEAEDEGMI